MNFESRFYACGSLIESRIKRPHQRPNGRFLVMVRPRSLHLFLLQNLRCPTGRVWCCLTNLLRSYLSGVWNKHFKKKKIEPNTVKMFLNMKSKYTLFSFWTTDYWSYCLFLLTIMKYNNLFILADIYISPTMHFLHIRSTKFLLF